MKSSLQMSAVSWLRLVLAVAGFWLMVNKQWKGHNGWDTNICSDGRGYYAWLPATLIYNDLNFSFADSVEHVGPNGGCLQDYRLQVNGRYLDKYYPGAAFCMLPFFAAAHSWCVITGQYPANGYSPPYFIMIGVAGWLFLQLGVFLVNKVLKELKFDVRTRFITLLVLVTGSNFISYGIDFPSYSHIYSLVVITAATWLLIRICRRFSMRDLLLLAFLAGWMVAIRPINLTWFLVFAVLIADRAAANNIFSVLLARPWMVVAALFAFAVMPLALVGLYYGSSGSVVLYSYKGESFDFIHPNIMGFIFSQDNGMFLYTPALIVSMVFSLFSGSFRKPWAAVSICVLVISMYVHSSWWCWWYGHGFGSRTMLDMNVFFAVLIAYSLSAANKNVRKAAVAVYLLCAALTMILYHQAHHGFLGGFPKTDYVHAVRSFFGI